MESVNSLILGRSIVKVNSRKTYNCLEGVITIKTIFDKVYNGPLIPGTLIPMFPDNEQYYNYFSTEVRGSATIKFLERFSFSKNNQYRIVINDKNYRMIFYGSIEKISAGNPTLVTLMGERTLIIFNMILHGKKNRLFRVEKI